MSSPFAINTTHFHTIRLLKIPGTRCKTEDANVLILMRMNGSYKTHSPFEGRYNLHISPNCTLNLSTKQSFDKACVKEESRTGKVRSIFGKHFLPRLNVIKAIILLRSFQENSTHFSTFPPVTYTY